MLFQRLSLIIASLSLSATVGTFLPLKAQNLEPFSRIIANSPTPVTYMTPRNNNQIAVQIKEGEFTFRGTLRRTSGNMFIAEDRQVRVMYDRGTSRLVVINKKTGTELYNYIFSMADEGSL
ncbi:hypothetical protein [Gloeothece verrucosa]|uniref:Uncharacterized protein n=1 Tax=Gloeothece verrucosa (strain PCC 7822) TaxID=497965 RepID=E0UDU2_GLOV7|nr:hypothetical protein [Gloeothece verrucosa]ADN16527.1 conserved hypothetical protein [Gloeothece verrucosa PCC 7822]